MCVCAHPKYAHAYKYNVPIRSSARPIPVTCYCSLIGNSSYTRVEYENYFCAHDVISE